MKRPFTTWLILLGWGVAVIAGVRLVERGLEFRRNQLETLSQAQEQLRRLQGWVAVESEVEARRNEMMGPFLKSGGTDFSWVALQGLQRAAKEEGISLTELRPAWNPGQEHRPAVLRIDAKMEGLIGPVTGLLRRLPEEMPAVQLENFQLMSQGGDRVQALLRIRLEPLLEDHR
ncbi:MAG: hypothetical protein HY211_05075 [Candidatus Omnitrophica bacterium]|nr:hypothetical protein [Candidatus Omnitrophota bacterium]